ncbi:uncharacterized protein BDV14DRAFT_168563 [Aspergillus stella-maris]|uniref:uncharacterized protein n=1 Tax=Aspergillus stella-maris TaxID=1810926 RepID=UPI003CCDB3A8
MNTLAALLLVSVLPLTNTIELTCNNEDKTNCINAVNKGTHSFSFGDLFPENATFVYGLEPLTAVGSEELDNKDGLQKIAFWLEYPSLHTDKTALEISQVGMLFTNASGSLGGGNNGCNGLLSEACAENLKDALKWGLLSHLHEEQNQSLPNALRDFHSTPLANLSCPTDLFDDEALITTWNSSSGDVARLMFSLPHILALLSQRLHWTSQLIHINSLPRRNNRKRYDVQLSSGLPASRLRKRIADILISRH